MNSPAATTRPARRPRLLAATALAAAAVAAAMLAPATANAMPKGPGSGGGDTGWDIGDYDACMASLTSWAVNAESPMSCCVDSGGKWSGPTDDDGGYDHDADGTCSAPPDNEDDTVTGHGPTTTRPGPGALPRSLTTTAR